jgi:spermidine synthase
MVWQRLLTFFSGADVYSVTLIVAAFMGGLGFGSLAGGHLADRLSPRGRFLAFVTSELSIAAFAFVSVPLLHDVLFRRLGARALPAPAMAAVLFAVLLWPTFFMGLSLPLLSRVLTERAGRSAERIGGLYGWNTLGAALGALVTVWGLARTVGFAGAVRIGAFLNLGCAAAALLVLARGWHQRGPGSAPAAESAATPEAPAEGDPEPEGARLGLLTWLLTYALSGFIALSLEILWFRVLGTIHKPSSFTFSTLLAIYLLGLGAGALLGRRAARRSRRPAATFFALQAGIGLYAGLSLGLLTQALGRVSWLRPLWVYLGEYETLALDESIRALLRMVTRLGDVAPFTNDLAAQFALLYGGVPLFLIGPPTLLMGMSFPFIQRAVQTDVVFLGRRVGWLQAANIVGSTLGAGATGLFLLQHLGSAGTLRLLVGLAGIFLLAFCRLSWPSPRARRWASGGAVGLVGLALLMAPSAPTLWAKLHGTTPDRILFAEDGSGLSVLKDEAAEGKTIVYVDGLGQSQLPYGGYHTLLGALPVMLHPRPASVAVLGLGSGDTLFGISGRGETERIVCLEIVAPQLRTLQLLSRLRPYPGLGPTLADGRVDFRFTDGRSFLMRTKERFDVIEADALRPGTPYVGNLYSLEYFELLRQRLKPGGLGVTWSPTARVKSTFLRAFPYVMVFGETLVGSGEPIPFDPAVVRGHLREPFTVAHYARGGVDPEALLAELLDGRPVTIGPEVDRSPYVDVNTDLHPKDEYLSSRRFLSREGRP